MELFREDEEDTEVIPEGLRNEEEDEEDADDEDEEEREVTGKNDSLFIKDCEPYEGLSISRTGDNPYKQEQSKRISKGMMIIIINECMYSRNKNRCFGLKLH